MEKRKDKLLKQSLLINNRMYIRADIRRKVVSNTIKHCQNQASSLATHPLAQLSQASTGLSIKLDEKTEATTMASSIEAKLSSCLYLGSSSEYRYWLGALVKNLARAGQETRLRTIFDDLLGPGSSSWSSSVLGVEKKVLLEEVLPHVATNMSLQRLYTEYKGQLKGNSDLFS